MQTCQVSVSSKVSGRESVGNGGTVPVSDRESVGSDGTVSVSGRELVGSDGTVLNSGQQRLGRGCENFALSSGTADRMGRVSAVTMFHFVIDEGMQPDAQNRKSNKLCLLTGHSPFYLITFPIQPRP